MPGLKARSNAGASMVVKRALRLPIQLVNPVDDHLEEYARENLKRHSDVPMVEADCFHGQVLALCGAGPSLNGVMYPADQVWGCNSAMTWLYGNGPEWMTPDMLTGIGIDQTDGMLRDWETAPPVTYYVATTCDPKLIDHLKAHGREIRFFHNMVGFDGELEHYREEWAPSFMVATGATVVGRTIGLAAWMGFRRVDVYGADCSFGPEDIAHANGDTCEEAYGQTMTLQGQVGGRTWKVRADMLMSAVDLVRRLNEHPGRIRLMGDTLPVALMGMDDEYLDLVIRRLEPGEKPPNGE